jgi:hypothetical protein
MMAERAAKAGNSGLGDPEKLKGFVSEIEEAHERLLKLRMDYMTKCKVPRGDIKAILDAAKDAGVPKASLRAVVKSRELERKAVRQRDDLADLDLQAKYDAIRHALGDLADTPLGKAATPTKPAGLHAV